MSTSADPGHIDPGHIDLGLGKQPAGSRVVVAMSGGVDSSTVAALLVEAGYDVVGVTLQLYDHGKAVDRKGACCAGRDVADARAVADRLGIPHYVLDFEQRFADAVIADFADSYAAGRTPVPCIRCNQRVKFRDLLGIARDLGAEALATGHYARWVMGASGPELHQAADMAKDQSYFLFATTRDQLAFLRFPLGDRTKAQTRAAAARFGLAVADKPDSQDICFVPTGHHSAIVGKLRPEAMEPGQIVDLSGAVVGSHVGVAGFTVGQRRGLGVAASERLYVLRIEAGRQRVTVGRRAEAVNGRIIAGELSWLGREPLPPEGRVLDVRHRYNERNSPARVTPLDGNRVAIDFAEPQTGVAPGQACVFYAGTRLMGGAWITDAPLLDAPVASVAGMAVPAGERFPAPAGA